MGNSFRKKNFDKVKLFLYESGSAIRDYVIAVLFIVVATGVIFVFRNYMEKAHMGLLYLLAITGVAALGGTRLALLAALLGFLSWNFFFLPPHYTFVVHDVRDWFLLMVFLVIAAIVGQITGNLKKREAESLAREKETTTLYKAALSLNTGTRFEDVLELLLNQIQQSTKAAVCAILRIGSEDKVENVAGAGDTRILTNQNIEMMTTWAWHNVKSIGLCQVPAGSGQEPIPWPVSVDYSQVLPSNGSNSEVLIPLSIKDHLLGILFARPEKGNKFSSTDCRFLVTFSEIVATFLERNRLIEEAAQVAALKESEHLKAVLFSSISHNLKNPLVSLNASLESLLQQDVEFKPEILNEHLLVMAEDIHRLRENIENLLSLAQLESGLWKPRLERYDLREIFSIALSQLPERDYKRIKMYLPDELFLVWVDSVQISQVVHHIIENALTYSPANSEVVIGAKTDNRTVQFCIDDRGPGVPPEERDKIFEKFYHKNAENTIPGRGAGLGLAICKEIVQAHNGKITVEDSPEGGARFLITLPMKQPQARKS